MTKNCLVCGAEFQPTRKYPLQRYCGHKCAFKVTGPKARAAAYTPEARAKHADARRGRGKGDGYVKRGGRHEHRVVAEQMIGRPLRPEEIVHHDDEVKRNNAPNNLVITDRVTHGRIHNLGKKRRPKMVCKVGHPLEGDNVQITWAGMRQCMTCRRAYDREYQRKKRAAKRQQKATEAAP